MLKIYHVDRDFSKPLSQQKRELKAKYNGFTYLFSDGRQIHFIAE